MIGNDPIKNHYTIETNKVMTFNLKPHKQRYIVTLIVEKECVKAVVCEVGTPNYYSSAKGTIICIDKTRSHWLPDFADMAVQIYEDEQTA